MTDRKNLSLWEALLWAYRKQRAHIYLRSGRLCFEWAIASAGLTDDTPRPRVHWDAAMIHGAVCEIGEKHGQHVAEAVILAAVMGERPELPDSAPVPMPYEIDGHRRLRPGRMPEYTPIEIPPSEQKPPMSRPGRGYKDGRRIEVLIRTVDFEVVKRPVYERTGRNKYAEVGQKTYWMPIEYCPLRWEPDPGYYAAAIGTYRAWREGMVLLAASLSTLGLKEHTITAEEIQPAPEMPIMESAGWDLRSDYIEANAEVVRYSMEEVESRIINDEETLVVRQARATLVR